MIYQESNKYQQWPTNHQNVGKGVEQIPLYPPQKEPSLQCFCLVLPVSRIVTMGLWVKGLWISTLLYTSAFTEGYSQLLTDKMIFRKTLQDLISNSSVVFHHRVFPICLISIHFTFMVNYSITLGG